MIKLQGRVASFFIFNSTFGPREGEELKRILYFHPAQVSPDARKNQVGLCEAVVKFMSTFSSEPCEALHTQSKRHVFYQPEKNYWMVMIIRVSYTSKSVGGSGESRDQIQPKVMYDLLVSAYRMFKLFMGPFSETPPEELYSKCEHFFTPYLSQCSLSNDILDVIKGINYLPLDKSSFFKVMCLLDMAEVKYPELKCVTFLYNDQVMWNCLQKDDTLTIYEYLVFTLLPEHVEREIQGGAVAAAQRHGRYISPKDGIRTNEDLSRVTKVHLIHEDDVNKTEQNYLIVYRALSATVCFTLKADKTLSLDTFRSLDTFIGPRLSTIASYIGEQVTANAMQSLQQASDAKFVYFNRLNLAFKTSLTTNKLVASSLVKPEVLNCLADMHADRKSLGSYGEVIVKTVDDYWITGKSSNEREFYVVIQQKNANLKEISDEVKRVCDAQMKGIFFYPV